MTLAPWREPLARALHRNRSNPVSRYFQLATITSKGLPTNRTVVFRGFFPNTNQLQIITDSRSEKISHIEQQPWGEVCWYFTKTREQFRLAGKLTLITTDSSEEAFQKELLSIWQNLSDSARLQFAWPYPGKPREKDESAFSAEVSDNDPLPNFCLLLLDPEKVDHLELRGTPQNRYLYTRKDSQTWLTQEINP